MPEDLVSSGGLRADRDRFVAFAFTNSHLLIETDPRGVVVYATGASCGLCQGGAETLVGQSLPSLVSEHDDLYFGELLTRLERFGRVDLCFVAMRTVSGRSTDLLMGASRLPNRPDRRYFSFAIAPRGRTQSDRGVSGLLSRQPFIDNAQRRLNVATQAGLREGITMMTVDGLDRLRQAGRSAQVTTATDRLGALLRAAAIGGELAGDLGSDEFAVVHPHRIEVSGMRDRAGAILDRHAGGASVSRCVHLPFDAGRLPETDATKALLYSIQQFCDGPSSYGITSLQAGAKQLLDDVGRRVSNVRQIIDRRSFDVVYQPVVDLGDDDVHHLEALTRVTGIASPSEFIRFTEEVGMVEDFDLALSHKVLETLSAHARAGWTPIIAVNLTASSLSSPLFVEQLRRLCDVYPDVAYRVMVEVTEIAGVHDLEGLGRTLMEFRRRGHKVCIDDIRSDPQSIRALNTLSVDFAKIDGQFIRSAQRSEKSLKTLKSVVETSRERGLTLIAEQLEEPEQARLVTDLGILYGQGFMYGRPNIDYYTFAPATRAKTTHRGRRRGDMVVWG